MKLEELFKKVEAYNQIAEELKGMRIVILAELHDAQTGISYRMTDERFCGPAKPYFLTWEGFKENLLNEYSIEVNKLVMDGDLDEDHFKSYILRNYDICKDSYLRFEITYR